MLKIMKSDKNYFNFVDNVYGETINEANITNLAVVKACRYVLCQKLKSVCYVNGKEKNKFKAAGILHQLAKVQQTIGNVLRDMQHIDRLKNVDKIALIRSAVLFNAAIVRKPDNVREIEADLQKLCSHVLKLAKAQNKKADLVDGAEQLFQKVVEMREMVSDTLKKIPLLQKQATPEEDTKAKSEHAEKIENLQLNVAVQYKNIMSEIMEYCVSVMGNPPCKYALVGMGSLARREITPYSDFENIIILEDGVEKQDNYEEILEYFRWVATIFQIILVNFQETIVRFMAVPGLEWYYDSHTPCGVSPDGFAQSACKNALGRQEFSMEKPWKTELINPISKMLKYLQPEENHRNGFHLAEMLAVTCFVSGDQRLHQIFQKKVNKLSVHELLQQCQEEIQSQVEEFNILYNITQEEWKMQMDLKRIAYRSVTIFLSALGRKYKLLTPSNFDIARNLPHISQNIRQNLIFAVSASCEVRLRAYTGSNAQNDMIEFKLMSRSLDALGEIPHGKISRKMKDIIGREAYFYCFKCALYLPSLVARVFNLTFTGEFYGLQYLQIKEEHFNFWRFDMIVKHSIGLFDEIIEDYRHKATDLDLNPIEHDIVARAHMVLQDFEAAKEHFQLALKGQKWDQKAIYFAIIHQQIGICNMQQENYTEALKKLEKANTIIKNLKNLDLDIPQKTSLPHLICSLNLMIGTCHYNLANLSEAAKYFRLFNKLSVPGKISRLLQADVYASLARCEFLKGNVNACLELTKKEIEERAMVTMDETLDLDIAHCYAVQGFCYILQGKVDLGKKYFAKAQSTFKADDQGEWQKKAVVLELFIYGFKLANVQGHSLESLLQMFDSIDSAFTRYDNIDNLFSASNPVLSEMALNMLPQQCSSLPQDMNREETPDYMMQIAMTQMENQHYKQAMASFKMAQLSWRFLITPADKRDAECYRNIAECLMKLYCYEGAVKNYLQEYRVLQSKRKCPSNDILLIEVFGNIEKCFSVLNNKEKALQFSKLKHELVTNNKKLMEARARKKEGRRLVDQENFDGALKCFEQELSVRDTMEKSEDTKDFIAECLFWIGLCYFKLHIYQQAMSFLQQARDIWETKPAQEYSKKITKCLKWLGKCHYEMGNIQQSFALFETELRNRENLSSDIDHNIAMCYYNIALCYAKCYETNEAASHFKLAQITWENNGNPKWATNITDCKNELAKLQTETEM